MINKKDNFFRRISEKVGMAFLRFAHPAFFQKHLAQSSAFLLLPVSNAPALSQADQVSQSEGKDNQSQALLLNQ